MSHLPWVISFLDYNTIVMTFLPNEIPSLLFVFLTIVIGLDLFLSAGIFLVSAVVALLIAFRVFFRRHGLLIILIA